MDSDLADDGSDYRGNSHRNWVLNAGLYLHFETIKVASQVLLRLAIEGMQNNAIRLPILPCMIQGPQALRVFSPFWTKASERNEIMFWLGASEGERDGFQQTSRCFSMHDHTW